jgi:hypothetical protein
MPDRTSNKVGGTVRGLTRNAAQSVSATLVSGAKLARVAAGLLAGVADSLARRAPRAPRKR